MSEEFYVINKKDGTPFGFDVAKDGRRVWYFIQEDVFGDGSQYCIWNPDNRLRSYKSFKEALIYLAIAEEVAMLPETKCRIVRSFNEYDFRNIIIINTKIETVYYELKF